MSLAFEVLRNKDLADDIDYLVTKTVSVAHSAGLNDEVIRELVEQELENRKRVAAAQDILESLGWEYSWDNTLRVSLRRQIETAVGPKEATISINKSDGFLLTADYQSEGRNVLETTWVMKNDFSPEAITDFHNRCMRAIDDSYARRLHLLSPV